MPASFTADETFASVEEALLATTKARRVRVDLGIADPMIGGLRELPELIHIELLNAERTADLDHLLGTLSEVTKLETLIWYWRHDRDHRDIPDSINRLTQIRTLLCFDSRLPHDLSGLRGLQHLSLMRHRMTILPPSIAHLANLETLSLEEGLLQELPDAIADVTRLRSLELGGNQLASLPRAMLKLAHLESLSVEDNPILDLPAWLAELPALREVLISKEARASGEALRLHRPDVWVGVDTGTSFGAVELP